MQKLLQYSLRKLVVILTVCVLAMTVLAGCGGSRQAEQVDLLVSAAASLQDVAEELKDIFEKKHANVVITYNFASSGALQKQIEEGAPADLFISAGKSQMDALAEKGLLLENSRKDLLGNELVLIAGKDSNITGFEDLTGSAVDKIAVGEPSSVPVGQYSKETLTAMNLWEQLEPKMVLAKDVRQVLTYVESGNVEAGLVYRTDAMISKDVKIVAAAPAGSSKPIVYPMAVIKETKHQKEAEEFADFLQSSEAGAAFEKYGFIVLK